MIAAADDDDDGDDDDDDDDDGYGYGYGYCCAYGSLTAVLNSSMFIFGGARNSRPPGMMFFLSH